jgi:hypothetical protein
VQASALDIGIVGDAFGLREVVSLEIELRDVKVMVDARPQGKKTLFFLGQLVRLLVEIGENFMLPLGFIHVRLTGLETLGFG